MASARAIEAGKAIIRVMLDRAEVDKDLRDMEARFRAASSTISSMGTALAATGAAMGGSLLFPLRYAANLEKVGVAYRSIVGDAGRAAAALADVKELAASTPFQFPELASAGQKLLAFGTASGQLAGELRMIGDVSAAVSEPIGEIAEVYGKARVQGRLFAEDINQLTGRGIPIIGELAKQFGVTSEAVKDLVKDGEVNFGHLQAAMIAMTSQGGFAFQMMAQQSQTFLGKLSTLVDDAMDAILPIGTELMATIGPAMDTIGQMIGSLATTLKDAPGLATAWMTAAASAVALGFSMIALSKAIAAVSIAAKVMHATWIVMKLAMAAAGVTAGAMLITWAVMSLAIYGSVVALKLLSAQVQKHGIQVVVTTIAQKAWTIAKLAGAAAMSVLTNGVKLGKLALGGFLIVTNAAKLAQAAMTGNLIAGFFAQKGLAAGSALVASAFGFQTLTAAALAGAQNVASIASIGLAVSASATVPAAAASGASAGFTATAWAIAAGVVEFAYNVITFGASGLLKIAVPAIIALGSGLAVLSATYATASVASEEMGSAWNYVKSSVGGIASVVMETAAGIKDALAAGQYMQAAQMLWTGVQRLFWMGVRATVNAVRTLPGYVMDIMNRIATKTMETLWNLFSSIPSLIAAALRGENISNAVGAMLKTGDWLEGLATDRINEASTEMQALKLQVEQAAKAQKLFNEQLEKMKELGIADGDSVAAKNGKEYEANRRLIDNELVKRGITDRNRRVDNTAALTSGSGTLIKTDGELSAAQERIKSLRDEMRELELGAAAAENAKLIEEAKAKGQSDETIRAEIAALNMMRKRKQYLEDEADATEATSDAIVRKIEAQASDLAENGMTADEIYRRQIEALDKNAGAGRVNGEDAQAAKEQAAADRDERLKSRADEGKQLADSLKTPLERFNDEVLRIQGLRASGNITGDTANRAIARERETLAQATNKSVGGANSTELGIATLGSKKAFDAIARTRSASVGSDIGPRVSPEMRAQLAAVNRQVQATEQLPARFAESVQAQVVAAINTKRLEVIASKSLGAHNRHTAILQSIERNQRADGGEPL